MKNTPLIFQSATEIAAAIQSQAVSSHEVVQMHLDRIEAVNPQLNAVVQVAAESALARATAADEALKRGESWGPLHGLPMTIKDSFDTDGVISTWGTSGRNEFVPQEDATIVKRLKAAGAILLGKTNTPEFTLSGETDNPIYGRTSNPYDLTRSSSGSSGGAAAIVAAGGSPFDIGTDTRGSIRQPAHACGLAGLKPTSGRVPRSGHAIGPGGLVDALTTVGPLARSVADLSLIWPLIAGPDGIDHTIAPVPIGDPASVKINQLSAIFYTDNGIATPTPEIKEVVEAVVQLLSNKGVQFEEKRPTGIEESNTLFNRLMTGWDGGAWRHWLLQQVGTPPEKSTLRGLDGGTIASPVEIVQIIADWDRFRREMLSFMAPYDLIICPVNTHPAIPHGTLDQHFGGFDYTGTYNLTGWPAAVVRAGTSRSGLPIGIQIVAKPWHEAVSLAVASVIEAAFGGWQRPML